MSLCFRIEIPCRGKACGHLQCYDLGGYLQVSRSTKAFNSRWRCPQCHLTVLPADLVVDAFFLQLLRETGEDDTEVELQAVSIRAGRRRFSLPFCLS